MAELAALLRREARRQAARPELLAAVLAGRSWAYARHRLGFMSIRMLLRSASHALEIQLLLAAFVPFEYLAPLLAYRAICSLLGAAHWGALEPLRAQVRQAAARRELGAARRTIESWLALTLVASVLGVLGVLALEVGSALFTGRVQLRDAYGLACVLRLALDCCLRVLHSGVFALRRVHRPLWSTLAPDVLELSVIALGFGALGIWSIPLATLAGAAGDAVLGLLSVRRAYAQRRLPWPRIGLASAGLSSLPLRAASVHALGGVMLQLDGLLLLLLLHSGRGGWFAALYYVLRPLMAASTHWVRGFYFDLKLLEAGSLAVFRAGFRRFLERLGLGWALGLALLTLGFAHVLWPEQSLWPLLWLLPFFLARSAFALAQLAAFGAGRLHQLLGVSLFALLGLIACRLLGLHALQLLAASSLLLALGAAWSAREARHAAAETIRPGLLDVGEWLAWLRETPRVQLAVLRVDARSARAGAVLRGIRAAFPHAALTRWGSRHVLLAVAEGSAEPTARALVAAAAGALGR
ncbi:MAG TPA: hypothetical protein VJR89_17905, partial [Polyangiales bacterium]|nr:hypothetical protein [Polyangiales bacterium]